MTTPTPPGGNFPSGNLNNISYGSPAAGSLMGTNALQQSVDSNTRAISNLASSMSRLLGAGRPTGNAAAGGVPWVSPSLAAAAAARFPPIINPFTAPPGGPASAYPPPPGGVPWVSARLGYAAGAAAAGQPTGFGPVNNGAPYVNWGIPRGSIPVVGPTAMRLPNGAIVGSTGPPGGPRGPGPGGYAGGLPQQPPGFFRRNAAMIGGVLGAAAGASFLFGRSMLSDQVAANLYTSTATTAAPLGADPNSINSLARYQAFGQGGRNLNGVAFNTQDAASGAAALGYAGGYTPGMQMGANGRAVNSAFNTFGLGSPTLGAQGAASLAGTMYSQNVALRMQMLGYRTTPRTTNGGWNSPASVVQGYLQRWYGSNSVNEQTLKSSLSAGGVGTYNLQAIGYNPQQISQMTPGIEIYNKLFQAGLSTDKAQSLINRATRGSQNSMLAAQDELASKYGVQKSDLQALKDKQAITTGNRSDIANGFNSTLQESVKLLGDFNQMLNSLMRATGLSNVVGGFAGAGGAFSTVTHGGMLGLGAGLAMRLLGRGAAGAALGGGGAAAAGAGAGAGAGGAAGAGAGAGLLARLGLGGLTVGTAVGTLGVTALLETLGHLHNKNGTNMLQQGPGGPNSAWNNWGTLGKDVGHFFQGSMSSEIQQLVSQANSHRVNVGGGASGMVQNTGQTKQKPGSGNKQTVGGSVSAQARAAVNAAETKLGDPYVWGADGPNAFDCSGLVEWAYKQAGIQLPRTSEQMYAGLANRGINLKNVQEGDLVFAAGSGGTFPGHVAMMINQRQIIEAQGTGIPVHIRSFNPHEWAGAARVKGSLAGQGGPLGGAGGPGASGQSSVGPQGNYGMGGSAVGFGATEATTLGQAMSESEMLAGGGGAFGGFLGNNGSSGNGGGSSTGRNGRGSGPNPVSHRGTANLKGNQATLNKWASKFGWGRGKEWNALYTLEMHEAGFNNLAQNPNSTAYGMGQFLDTTWAGVGGHKTSDPNLQAEYMMRYIKNRYGDPIKAWAQYYDHPGGVGWYGGGGRMRPGEIGVVGDRGPELVAAGKDGATVMSAARTSELLSGMSSITQQVGSLSNGRHHASSNVSLNFGPGSVVLSTLSGNYNDSANAARVFIRKLRKELENEHVYMVIAEGGKN